ncbi:MAG TPA: MFS transporter [Acidimicrobiales bacterium]
MPRLEARWSGAQAEPKLLEPRDDLILERPAGPGRFEQAEGPFRSYERTVSEGADGAITEVTSYRLAIPWFGWAFARPTRRSLLRPPDQRLHGGRQPWWAPPQRLDARAAHVLGLLAAAQLTVGFCNAVFSQTAAFAADEFGASEGAQGVAGSIVRLGIVFTVILLALADRVGRRRILVGTAIAAPLLAAIGAVAPSLAALTAIQTVARPVAIALGLVVTIVAAEEMPAGSRAYAVSVLGLAYALGAGTCVWVLPLADLGVQGWRLIYAVGLVYLVVAVSLARGVPESRRYVLPHAERAPLPGRRFLLLAASAFLYNLLIAPTTFYENRYLKDVQGYSATLIAVFTIVTATPGAIGILIGGRLADVKGRRLVGTVALIAVAVGNIVVFSSMGAELWGAKLTTSILAGMAVPALGVYAAELFPTSRRGGANGGISALSIIGSVAGLLLAGQLLDRGATYGTVVTILAIGPLIYAALVVFAYPETARRSLDDINPEDRTST